MMVTSLKILLVGAVLSTSSATSPLSAQHEGDFFSTTNFVSKTHQVGHTAAKYHRSLQSGDESLQKVCSLVESQFEDRVDCTCSGSPFTSFNLNCEYLDTTCGAGGRTCGKPVIALSLADGGVFSAAACVTDFKRDGVALGDTCISVDLCEDDSNSFCDCTVTFDDQICDSCTVCGEGRGLALDCSNVNAEAVTTECQSVSFDLSLNGEGESIVGFLPSFQGLCSELEAGIDDRIACDCSNSGGGTFSITCETLEDSCTDNVCGGVKSEVQVVDSEIQTVTACVDFSAPLDLAETCTQVQICEDDSTKICGCTAIYDGAACNSCEVCEGGNGLKLDCTNIRDEVVIDTCQAITAARSFEFIPNFDIQTPAPTASGGVAVHGVPLVGIVAACLGFVFL
jgi:hypothetical protein